MDIQDIFINNIDFIQSANLPKHVKKTALDIAHCRTNAMNGHLYQCPEEHFSVFLRNSCNNRFCPKCQYRNKELWNDATKNLIINTDHYHLVFKLPTFCYPYVTTFYKEFLNLLFEASKKTILKILKLAFDKNVIPGYIMVLHTHGKLNQFHPHIHVLITDGGLDKDNNKWVLSQNNLFDFYQFNSIYKIILKKELLAFYKNHPPIGNSFLDQINSNYKMFAFTSEKISDPYHVIDYFTNSIKGSNIKEQDLNTDDNLVSINNGNISSQLSQKNFIKRYLLHVLPIGTKSIRYFGIYSHKAKNCLNSAKLLFPGSSHLDSITSIHPENLEPQFDYLPYKFCPVCKKHMILIEKTLPFLMPIYVLHTFGDQPPNLELFNSVAA